MAAWRTRGDHGGDTLAAAHGDRGSTAAALWRTTAMAKVCDLPRRIVHSRERDEVISVTWSASLVVTSGERWHNKSEGGDKLYDDNEDGR